MSSNLISRTTQVNQRIEVAADIGSVIVRERLYDGSRLTITGNVKYQQDLSGVSPTTCNQLLIKQQKG